MNQFLLRLSVAAIATLLGVSSPHYAQNASSSVDLEKQRHITAVNLLRAVNTAEVTYKVKHSGAYATWDSLVANGDFTEQGTKWGAGDLRTAHFSNASEILPGWKLRLNVTADGKSYDLLLEDLTDNKCGYAAVTDERGVIRQAKAIDCKI